MDPERTHFLWGLSKDFGLAGFRMGFIHTYNKVFLFYYTNIYTYYIYLSVFVCEAYL